MDNEDIIYEIDYTGQFKKDFKKYKNKKDKVSNY